ncbi:MAG: acyl carrier protein [Oscillospiraceae bacterium]|jgi:acyl carrier protein|nr:acyl carrier protein [Oscillospiraceae bacterium]
MTTFEKVAKAVADRTGRDISELASETDVRDDLGMDSLDAVELLMELEEEFGISLPSEQTADVKTIGEIAALVDRIAGAAQQP